jgi:tetratricopeptide (TPR) repeat protein
MIMRILPAISVLFLFFSCGPSSKMIDELLVEANTLIDEESYQEAVDLLQDVPYQPYKADSVNYLIGLAYFEIAFNKVEQKGQSDDMEYHWCLGYLEDCIELNPDFFDAYISKYNVLHNLGRHTENIEFIEKTHKYFKDSIRLIELKASTKYGLGDYVGSNILLDSFLTYENLDTADLVSVYRFKGNNYLGLGNHSSAIEAFTLAIDLDPETSNGFLFRERAIAYRKSYRKEEACTDYRKAFDLGVYKVSEQLKNYCN